MSAFSDEDSWIPSTISGEKPYRTGQAMDFENYLELGYYRMNRNCYGKDEVELSAGRSRVASYPLQRSCMPSEDNVWVWKLSYIDEQVCCGTATRRPPAPEEIMAANQKMYRTVPGDCGILDFMIGEPTV